MKIKFCKISQTNFSKYGDVIELPQKPDDPKKVQRQANVSVLDFEDGKPVIDVLYSPKRPLQVTMLEMHNNSTQTFIPLGEGKFLVVVGKDVVDGEQVNSKSLKAFITNGFQGITLKTGVWHCSPLPLKENISFTLLHRSPDVDLGSQVITLKEDEILEFELS